MDAAQEVRAGNAGHSTSAEENDVGMRAPKRRRRCSERFRTALSRSLRPEARMIRDPQIPDTSAVVGVTGLRNIVVGDVTSFHQRLENRRRRPTRSGLIPVLPHKQGAIVPDLEIKFPALSASRQKSRWIALSLSWSWSLSWASRHIRSAPGQAAGLQDAQ